MEDSRAHRLPEQIKFGTSSWTYPGWSGTIYHDQYRSDSVFKAECLSEYPKFPWFRSVGLDSSFYGPPAVKTLLRMKTQLPSGFPVLSKVWEELTVYEFPNHSRYGKKAGTINPNFLNAELFKEAVLARFQAAEFESHLGPFIFQFGAFPAQLTDPSAGLIPRIGEFLQQLPRTFRYALEVRNPELLTSDYFAALNQAGATHCFNHWSHMPSIRSQMESAAKAGGLSAPFYVCRVLTPRGVVYEQAVKRFSPYNRLVAPLQEMRHDVVLLARRSIKRNVPAFVLVNNRAEGYAPGTIQAIGESIIDMVDT